MKANDLKRLKDIALSDKDVMKLVKGHAKVVLYSDLHKYKTLEQLLQPYGACFLLYEWQPGNGHWVAIIRHDKDTVEHFDPYGVFLDDELKWVPSDMKNKLNENYPYLTRLFYNSKFKNLTYNEHKFQKHGDGIKTCGRWSSMRILLKDMSLKDFSKVFKGKNADDIVTLLTTPQLHY